MRDSGSRISLSVVVGFEDSVVAVSSLINDVYLAGLGIGEHKEFVVEHIHLEDSLVNVHRTHLELLVFDYLVVHSIGYGISEGLLESCILELLLDLGLILADLSDF